MRTLPERRNCAAGSTRAARDAVDTSELERREAEQAALAAALARLEAAQPVAGNWPWHRMDNVMLGK